jgi:hypothetical protein
MRDFADFNYDEVVKIATEFSQHDNLVRRSHVLRDSTQYFSSGLYTFPKIAGLNKKEWITLAILSHYITQEEVRIYLQEDLRTKLSKLSLDDQVELLPLISSSVECQLYLESTSNWSTCDFFGNIFNKKIVSRMIHFLKLLKPLKDNVKRYSGYCRGPKDHNSATPSHQWIPRDDFSLTLLHQEIEDNRKAATDAISLIQGMLW